MVSGEEAAEMYQTYGFPPELFETMAAEHNLTFDWQGYSRAMEQHGIDSGGGRKVELFKRDPLEGLKKVVHGTQFLGYDSCEVDQAKVVWIVAAGQPCDKLEEIDHEHPVDVVLDKTPFYGEKGGQVGDIGELVGNGFRFEVVDTQVDGNFTLHRGHLRQGQLALGDKVTARVDQQRRQGIRRAHSATHLLHYALQKHLGQHAQQQGSKVDKDLLRFDFSNPNAVGPERLAAIEAEVNALVFEGQPIAWANMPLAEARSTGAMMLFGEKYPDIVRVVSMGAYSKELCGGTHLESTGQIGLFKVLGEESVSAGIRRITALTGPAALEHIRRNEAALARAANLLRVPAEEVPDRVEVLAKEVRQLKKQIASGPRVEGTSVEKLLDEAVELDGTKIVVAEVPGGDPNSMRQLIDQLRRKASPLAVMLASRQEEGRVLLIAGLSRELTARKMDAVAWVRTVAKLVDGGGGGRPDLAQAGGKKADQLPEALELARTSIQQMLGA